MSNFIQSVDILFSLHHLLRKLPLFQCIFSVPLSKICCLYMYVFTSTVSILYYYSMYLVYEATAILITV